jgi:hypothetical protein
MVRPCRCHSRVASYHAVVTGEGWRCVDPLPKLGREFTHHGVRDARRQSIQGIDVSRWQGEIDWEKVKDAGTRFRLTIQQADDAVQVRYHLLSECGTPMVSVVYRSAKLGRQVVEQIQHHAVKDGEKVIGYARQGSVLTAEDYGAEPEVALEVTGERAR